MDPNPAVSALDVALLATRALVAEIGELADSPTTAPRFATPTHTCLRAAPLRMLGSAWRRIKIEHKAAVLLLALAEGAALIGTHQPRLLLTRAMAYRTLAGSQSGLVDNLIGASDLCSCILCSWLQPARPPHCLGRSSLEAGLLLLVPARVPSPALPCMPTAQRRGWGCPIAGGGGGAALDRPQALCRGRRREAGCRLFLAGSSRRRRVPGLSLIHI